MGAATHGMAAETLAYDRLPEWRVYTAAAWAVADTVERVRGDD